MERLEYFKLFHEIDLKDYHLLISKLGRKSYKKGDFITVPGQIQRNLYFVNRGVQMSFHEGLTKEHVIAFTYPPNVCAIPESFAFQTPSKYYLRCLSDSDVDYISYDNLLKIFDESQQIERLFRKMTEAVMAGIINRHIELHSMSIEERFKAFCQRSPDLLQVVPHKHIASYLSIDRTNFSKLYNNVRI